MVTIVPEVVTFNPSTNQSDIMIQISDDSVQGNKQEFFISIESVEATNETGALTRTGDPANITVYDRNCK